MSAPLSERLLELRRGSGQNQASVAAEIGVSQGNLSMWESGERSPNLANLARLARHYKVPVGELAILAEPDAADAARPKVRPRATKGAAQSDELVAQSEWLLDQARKLAGEQTRPIVAAIHEIRRAVNVQTEGSNQRNNSVLDILGGLAKLGELVAAVVARQDEANARLGEIERALASLTAGQPPGRPLAQRTFRTPAPRRRAGANAG